MADEQEYPECPLCDGQGCEEGCGTCEMAYAGPDSHKVCTRCGGRGRIEKPEPEPIRYMDMQEFQEGGFLQEANRQFFHPLGLALEWTDGWKREGLEKLVIRKMKEAEAAFGRALPESAKIDKDKLDLLWAFVQEIGLDKPHIKGVWDYRDDPEGMSFAWDRMDHDEVIRKWISVSEEFTRHVPARRALFGEDGMEPTSVLVTSVQALPKKPVS